MKNPARLSIAALAVGAAFTGLAAAQENLAFEAATIKPAAPNAVRNQMRRVSPDRISIGSMTLTWLIYTAYGEGLSTSISVRGGPDWMGQTAWAVEAKAHQPATQRQFQAMLRTLLEDRFALKLHTGTEEGNIYALMLDRQDGKLGPRVRPWDGACGGGQMPTEDDDPVYPRCLSGYRGVAGLSLDGATMFSAAELLSLPQSRNLLGRVVQDRTGLAGRYKMDLVYRFLPPGPADAAAAPDVSQPSLFTAIREQWGLRLEPARGSFKRIVVDDAQRPGEN
jgi:uncharacterized protein (TIGR03435 family)